MPLILKLYVSPILFLNFFSNGKLNVCDVPKEKKHLKHIGTNYDTDYSLANIYLSVTNTHKR